MPKRILCLAILGTSLACGPPATSSGGQEADAGVEEPAGDAGFAMEDAGVVEETGLVGTWALEDAYIPEALAFRADGQVLYLEFAAGCSTTQTAQYQVDGDTLTIAGSILGEMIWEGNDRFVIVQPNGDRLAYDRFQVPCHTLPVSMSVVGNWEYVDSRPYGPKGFTITELGQYFELKADEDCLPYEMHRFIMYGRENAPDLIILDPGDEDSEQLPYEISGDRLTLGEGAAARSLQRVSDRCSDRLTIPQGMSRDLSGTWENAMLPGGNWFVIHFEQNAREVKIVSNRRTCEVADTFRAAHYSTAAFGGRGILWIDYPDNYTGAPFPGPTFFEWVRDGRNSLDLFPVYPGEAPEDSGRINVTPAACGL